MGYIHAHNPARAGATSASSEVWTPYQFTTDGGRISVSTTFPTDKDKIMLFVEGVNYRHDAYSVTGGGNFIDMSTDILPDSEWDGKNGIVWIRE